VGVKVGDSDGATDGTPRNIGPDDELLVVGLAVRTGVRSIGAAVAHCGSATRASIVTLASDLIDDRRLNDSRRPGIVVVHAAIDARRRARVRWGHDSSIEDRR